MSNLTTFRDHCRKMASTTRGPMTDAERALFAQLADEIDAYLDARGGLAPDLFGGLAEEPMPDPEEPA